MCFQAGSIRGRCPISRTARVRLTASPRRSRACSAPRASPGCSSPTSLLYSVTHDRALIARIETAKGWAFIGLASLLLYAVTFRSAARLDRVRRLTAAVVESIADGVLLLGHDRSIAYANPAAVRMLGRRARS